MDDANKELSVEEKRKEFMEKLTELCREYNITLYAGLHGICFDYWKNDSNTIIHRDGYYNQKFDTKEFIMEE